MFRGQLTELQALSRDHLTTYMRWFQDADLAGLVSPAVVVPVTAEAEEEWYKGANVPGCLYTFSIYARGDHRLIGNCRIGPVDAKNRSAPVGIVIGEREYWGRGYGTDAMGLLLEFGFDELNLHRIHLNVYPFNDRAIRCYRKLGFTEEGRSRDALFRGGRYWDVLHMSLLAPQWRQAPTTP